MKEIVKVLLAEGIDEDTIHEVLDILEADRQKQRQEAAKKVVALRDKKVDDLQRKGDEIYYKDLGASRDDTNTPNFDEFFDKKLSPALTRADHAKRVAMGEE